MQETQPDRQNRRRIYIASALSNEGVFIEICDGMLDKETVQSQFRSATGLKYIEGSDWVAVHSTGTDFVIPEHVDRLVVVTETVDRVRSILSNRNLAMQVSSVFGSSQGAISPSTSTRPTMSMPPALNLRPNLSRRECRNITRKCALRNPKNKIFRVVFIANTALPANLSKELVLCEGFLDINQDHSEDMILKDLAAIYGKACEKLKILVFANKMLSVPCMAPGMQWSLDLIKRNVGQGKLYVMVDEMSEEKSQSTLEKTSQILPIAADHDPDEDDFIEMGTPNITARRSRLTSNFILTENPNANLGTGNETDNNEETKPCQSGIDPENLSDASDDSKCYIPTNDEHLDSDNDAEMQTALVESLKEKPAFEQALKNWSKSVLTEEDALPLIIHRPKVLDSLKRSMKRAGFSWLSPVKVSFVEEIADDYGGPKREFFSLLMKEIAGLIGENGNLMHSVEKLEQKLFRLAGRCIVWSIMNGCEGCPFLNKGTLDVILDREMSFSVDDIQDPEAKAYVMQLQKVETMEEIPSDWLIDLGLTPPFNLEKKEDLCCLCLKQILHYRVHAEICQFKDGLESFGFLTNFREYPEGLQLLLCKGTRRLSFLEFKEMIQINYSPQGSNNRKEEEDAVYSLELFLLDCFDVQDPFLHVLESIRQNYPNNYEVSRSPFTANITATRIMPIDATGDLSIDQVLTFWTGCSAVPGMGFHKKLEVNFIDGTERLPVAHTCDMSLAIARGISPEAFQKKMKMAITWGGEFHLV